jgi:hypothetical protein
MSCEWRERQGLRYLYADYRGARTLDQMMAVLGEQLDLLAAEGPGSRLLIHVDAGDGPPPSQFLDAVKHATREQLEPLSVRVAFVGISGFGRIVLRGLQLVGGGGVPGPAFPDENRALDYLARG